MNLLTKREKRLCAILCNAVIVGLELVAAIISSVELAFGQFQYYTQDSNYFAMIVSAVFLVVALRGGLDKPLPDWVLLLRYIATCLLSVTFLVVIFILCPPYGLKGYQSLLLSGAQTFEHLLCPVFSFVSLFLFEETPKLKYASLFALVPTLVYAAVVIPLNAARVLRGPYPFLYIYEQPWWQSAIYAVVILSGSYLAAFGLLVALKKRKSKE